MAAGSTHCPTAYTAPARVKAKPNIPGERANRDVDRAVDRNLSEGAEEAALVFGESLELADRHTGCHPATGATDYAHEMDIPGLRSWPLSRYRYLVF